MSLQNGEARAIWKPGIRLRALFAGALDLLFPPQAFDGGRAPQTQGLSADAWSCVHFIEAPVCDGCGSPYEYDIGVRCAACLAKPRAFSRARAACLYDDASRDLILQFKHADRTDLAPLFARWIARAAPDLLAEADAVAPVPLHPGRLLARRYNQAAEIARPLARAAGLIYLPDVLTRSRATESQAGKSGVGRRRNLSGAIAVRESARGKVEGRRILLVDDVLTTGATAEACARVLRTAGAVGVDLAVIAKVKV